MAGSRHTPGPWHASRKFVYVSDIHNKCIAEIFDRNEANARLIAAAPDLLRALELMREAFEAFRLRPTGSPGSVVRAAQDAQIAAEDAARAAIAAATGSV